LKYTATSLGHSYKDVRALLQDWWGDAYLGTHEFVSNIDLYRRTDGSTLWLYFHYTGSLYQLGVDAVEENTSYPYWLLQSITPKTVADQMSQRDVIAWLNTSFGNRNPRTIIANEWCFDRSNYFSDGDFFVRADSTQLQYYSLTPLTDEMRKNGVTVDSLAFRFDEAGNIVSITPECVSTSMENVPILQPEEYFTIAASWYSVQAMLKRIVNLSPQPQAETAARLCAVWEGALQGEETYDSRTVYYYLFTVAGVSEKFHLLFDNKTGNLLEATIGDPFGPTGGEPVDSWYDNPWDVTPRDE
jgi:hypothetical protein